jgi:integrase
VDLPPPLAEHVESVLGLVAPRYVLPLLILDECEPRVSELEAAVVGDIDEERKAIRVRPDAEKNQRYRYVNLPDDLFAALVATLPPREDRDAAEPLFPGVTDATCASQSPTPAGTVVSRTSTPHGVRRRRGSLRYKRTGSGGRGYLPRSSPTPHQALTRLKWS